MFAHEIKKGQLVRSRQGRDKDKYYIIYDWDNEYVYVVDGYTRTVQSPKKKNLRHLWYTKKVDYELNKRIMKNEKVSNADIRETLNGLFETLDD